MTILSFIVVCLFLINSNNATKEEFSIKNQLSSNSNFKLFSNTEKRIVKRSQFVDDDILSSNHEYTIPCKVLRYKKHYVYFDMCPLTIRRIRFDCRALEPENDCLDHYRHGNTKSGIYRIKIKTKIIDVLCDQQTDGGGWTILQRRINNKTDFYRDWKTYKNGFGDILHSHWIGNDVIHLLTNQNEENEMLIILRDWNNKSIYAKYSNFYLGSENTGYQLTVSGYNGTAGDGLKYHNDQSFSTNDRDYDTWPASCSRYCTGAWWYRACFMSNLNGQYCNQSECPAGTGIIWLPNQSSTYSFKFVEMKVRRKTNRFSFLRRKKYIFC